MVDSSTGKLAQHLGKETSRAVSTSHGDFGEDARKPNSVNRRADTLTLGREQPELTQEVGALHLSLIGTVVMSTKEAGFRTLLLLGIW